MAKKQNILTLSSPLARAAAYTALFTVGAVIFQLLQDLINYRTVLPGVVVVIALPLIGALFISEQHPLSRIASASVLLLLSVMAIQFDNISIPSAYILTFALGISYIGSQRFLHRKPSSVRQTILFSASVSIIAAILTITFVFAITALTRIAIQSQGL